MTHNPTPWHVRRTFVPQDGADECSEIAWSEDGELVAESVYSVNAAFIVRACNAHDEMLATLKSLEHFYDSLSGARVRAIESAIATAEGR